MPRRPKLTLSPHGRQCRVHYLGVRFTTIIRRSASVQGIKVSQRISLSPQPTHPLNPLQRSHLVGMLNFSYLLFELYFSHRSDSQYNEVRILRRVVARHAPYRSRCPQMHPLHRFLHMARGINTEKWMLRLPVFSQMRWVFCVHVDGVFNLSVLKGRWTKRVFDSRLALRVGLHKISLAYFSQQSLDLGSPRYSTLNWGRKLV